MEKDIRKSMICVCTYQHYIDRVWVGTGLILSNYEDIQTFYLECLMESGMDSQFRFYDWHNIPDLFITSKKVAPCIFGLMEILNNLPEEEQEAFNLFLFNYVLDPFLLSVDKTMDHFHTSYQGKYDSIVEFAKEFAADNLAITAANSPMFDFEAYGRNLLAERFKMIDQHVFETLYIK